MRRSRSLAEDTALPTRWPLYVQVLLGVLVGTALGVAFGQAPWLVGYRNADLGPVGLLVVRMLKTLATPLVFVAIVDAFLKTSISPRSGLKLLAVCLVNVSVAMAIGLVLIDVLRPGEAWQGHLEALSLGGVAPNPPSATLDPLKNLAGFVPESVIDPFARNQVLSVVLLAVLVGGSLRRLRDTTEGELADAVRTTIHLVEVGQRVLADLLLSVAHLMPFAVALILADVVGKAGLAVFQVLWVFLAVILGGMLLHALGYYPLLAWVVGGRGPRAYLGGALDPVVTAVSCNSSLATMPVTLDALRKMGVSERAARLSACVGTNFNNDGIMLYEAMATLFLCQALGVPMSATAQATVVLSSVLAGVGIAGIPEAGLIILPLVLGSAGLPEAAIAVAVPLIVPVDWILARVRSGVNVLADLVVAVVLDRWGERD